MTFREARTVVAREPLQSARRARDSRVQPDRAAARLRLSGKKAGGCARTCAERLYAGFRGHLFVALLH